MQTKKTLRVGIVVGEHSGDLLGSELIKSLKNDNDIELYGIGGPKLSDLGLNSEFDFKKINVMGLIEPIKNFRELNINFTSQKEFLTNLGIRQRAEIICKNKTFSETSDIFYRLKRLIDKKEMGDLFKVMFIKRSSNNFQTGF